jgi:hypothetical protein
MRKITKQAVNAFMAGDFFRLDNTEVYCEAGGTMVMLLHGNPIARRNGKDVQVSTGGWETRTTLERINAILAPSGRRAGKRNHQLVLDGQSWDGGWTSIG